MTNNGIFFCQLPYLPIEYYNKVQQSTTKYMPFFLTYGRQAVMPVQLKIQSYPEEPMKEEQVKEILQRRMYDLIGTLVDTKVIAKENIQASQQLQKERHDRKIKNEQLQEEDLVLEYRSKDQNIYGDKFQPK